MQSPPELKMDQVDKLTPTFQSTHLLSLRESHQKLSEDLSNSKEIIGTNTYFYEDVSFSSTINASKITDKVLFPSSGSGLARIIDKLVHLISTPKRKCQKKVKLGGYFCRGKPEGTK